ncbi:MAG: nucleotidyl transferase AbiEii/AbiGii toxin family protein [Candidatus Aegiribacteria sp.]|nr:nucleotidyl transferase AbiEii/AbiGii toxin family protein [Candidatus Aegiribacteria sp.]
MQPDRERIEYLSAKTGFRINALEKVIRLTDILNDIFKHPFLSDVFVLKGGTALNLFFGPPSRLSVDLINDKIPVT